MSSLEREDNVYSLLTGAFWGKKKHKVMKKRRISGGLLNSINKNEVLHTNDLFTYYSVDRRAVTTLLKGLTLLVSFRDAILFSCIVGRMSILFVQIRDAVFRRNI